ncbi:Leucine rich adaptor protein 1, partial [Colius striatus]
AYLRAVDVKILQQLVVVNEGIEAVKWLGGGRGAVAGSGGRWDSLQDPNDRLDSISVGSYLDTLADDMDEYSQNAAESSGVPAPGRALGRAEQDWGRIDPEKGLAKQEKGRAEHEWPHVDLSPPGLPQDHRFAKEPKVANGKLHLEYDAHWRWLQSQDDVTFL